MNSSNKFYLIVLIGLLLISGSTFGTFYYLHSNQAQQVVVQEPLKVINDDLGKENEESAVSVVKDKTILTNTTAQVSLHKTQSDCWIVISGKIYNVSAFLDSHPGGVSTVTPFCGKDATSAFKTHGINGGRDHSAYAYSLLPTYFVSALNISKTNNTSVVTPPSKETQPKPSSVVPVPTPTPLPTPTPSSITYTSSVVASHNTQSDCWVVIQGKIYNVTSFMTSHPGGVSAIARSCGSDITTLFTTSAGHRHSSYAYSLLPTYFVADLGSVAVTQTTTPTPSPASIPTPVPTQQTSSSYSASQVATHNTQSDCWIVIQSKIYSVSSFMTSHPGGVSAIARSCGTDVTNLFSTSAGHRHSSYAYSLLPTYYVADLVGSSVANPAPAPTRTRYNDDD